MFLNSLAVGLLGLRIFELPAVGLPEFSHALTREKKTEFVRIERRKENVGNKGGRHERGHPNSDEAPGACNSDGRRGIAAIRGGSPENGMRQSARTTLECTG